MLSRVLLAGLVLGLTACGWAGEVTGKIMLETSPGARKIGQSRGTPGYEKGEVPPPSESEVENVIIYLEGKGLACTPQTRMGPRNTFVQKNKEFLPHVLPVPRGSKVYFRNQDQFPHHVYSVSNPGAFEIAKHGSTVRSQEFENNGEVEIFCGIHTKMNAYILVVDSDFYSSANRDGVFRLSGVPAGDYTLCMWHPRLPTAEKQKITVPSSGTVKLDLKL